jgi:hypothetical protein
MIDAELLTPVSSMNWWREYHLRNWERLNANNPDDVRPVRPFIPTSLSLAGVRFTMLPAGPYDAPFCTAWTPDPLRDGLKVYESLLAARLQFDTDSQICLVTDLHRHWMYQIGRDATAA